MIKFLYGLGVNVGFGVNIFCWFEFGCEYVDFLEWIECVLFIVLLFEICNSEKDGFDLLFIMCNVFFVVFLLFCVWVLVCVFLMMYGLLVFLFFVFDCLNICW